MGLWKNFTLSSIPLRGIFVQKNEWKNQKFRQDILRFLNAEGVRGKLPPTSNFFKFPSLGKLEKFSLWGNTGSACYSYQELLTIIVIMTFELSRLSERKLIKSGFFIKKVGITFYRFSENPKIPAGNAEQKVGITFFLKQIKSPSFVKK